MALEKEKEIVDETKEEAEVKKVETNNEEDLEFEDSATKEEVSEKVEEKKTQSKEENHKFAEMRRKKEEEEQEKKAKEAYNKGLIAGTKGINPYTSEKMEDEFDIEVYENMKEAEKRGLDPVLDYSKFMKIKAKEKAEEKAKEEESVEFIKRDREDFFQKNPDMTSKAFDELIKDELFNKMAKGRVGKEPLDDIFKDYLEIKKGIEEEAKKIALKKIAKKESSVGSIENKGGDSDNDLYSIDEIKKMSQAEISQNYEKVRRSLEKNKK